MTVLILASTSATRQGILERAGIAYRAIPPNVDETAVKVALRQEGATPRDIADALAELKGQAGWARSQAMTLGCDQTLDLDGECLDKALDLVALRAQLQRLRGRTHRLHSALVLVEGGRATWRQVVTAKLTMRAFSDTFLDGYLAASADAVLGSVGGYLIEAMGIQLFERVEGDHFAILGLPLLGLLDALRLRGFAVQ